MLKINISPAINTSEERPEEEYSETIAIKTQKTIADLKVIIRRKIESMSFKILSLQDETERNDLLAYSYDLGYFLFITITQMIPPEYIEKGWGEFMSLFYINIHGENKPLCKTIESEIQGLI